MKFNEAIISICSTADTPLTPQEIRERIKANYPQFYNTPTHLRNVEKGHYQNVDHALLAQIYITVRSNKKFICDKTFKPMKISLDMKGNMNNPPTVTPNRSLSLLRSRNQEVYSGKVHDILENAVKYHEAYYQAEVFSGPSLYFHRKAIAGKNSPTSAQTLESIYAVLTSWGMHRMGKGGPKMRDFPPFQESMVSLADDIAIAKEFNLQDMDEQKWKVLRKIFEEIDIMATPIRLVGNSKVMHHILPNLIPPIDREYTLWYLRGNTTIRNEPEWEWSIMKEFILNFFAPILRDEDFKKKATNWLERQDEYPWDTSTMKIVDNLIIGAKKSLPS